MKNIILIGMPGSGKTTLAKMAAQSLNYTFADVDLIVEESEGLSIPEIFTKFGEQYFRQKEAEVIEEISQRERQIVATGGGAILNEENVLNLKRNGILIYINRHVEIIAKDVDISNRPLLKDGPQKLFELFENRKELYLKCCDFIVENNETSEKGLQKIEEVAKMNLNYAVIGYPIRHSLSPLIHNTLFRSLNYQDNYVAFSVEKGQLNNFLQRAMNFSLKGFNLTMPHKVDIIPMLNEIDDDAKLCGSVNTLKIDGGKLYGYNTDLKGFEQALKSDGFYLRGKDVVVLGSGGVANAVCLKAMLADAKSITIIARSPYTADPIISTVSTNKPEIDIKVCAFSKENLRQFGATADIIINTTPLGMSGFKFDFESFEFLDHANEETFICDLIYSPRETNFLKEAKKRGLKTQNGLKMLIYQALEADKIFKETSFDEEEQFNIIFQEIISKETIK